MEKKDKIYILKARWRYDGVADSDEGDDRAFANREDAKAAYIKEIERSISLGSLLSLGDEEDVTIERDDDKLQCHAYRENSSQYESVYVTEYIVE